ncbi:hypothetical protein [Rhodococcus gannanensis]|uniref:Excreted virulence factor EspC, type VII ESX diderm n=1 Tax=Rhodococcus gannanensis TaxID=1960308 RepID=A0ABW4P1V3_9NOCA
MAADADALTALSGTLRALAEEAADLRTGRAAGYLPIMGGVMPSVLEASSISADLIDGTLVPALAERLGETGEVMGRIADEYRDADDAAAAGLAAAYTSATGDWSAE